MKFLANIVWLLTGGWLIGLLYLFGAIVFFPLFPFLYGLIGYGFWPFGRRAIPRQRLEEYRAELGATAEDFGAARRVVGVVANIAWAVTFGWLLALAHIIGSAINLAFFWLVITIPNIAGHWKLIPTAFAPFRRVVVSTDLADEIEAHRERRKHGLR
jgi:uncharacterized membrane protein YccF (DUF307 family)